MSIEIIRGNIFRTKSQVIVNTINCVGVMGAGLALEFRLRHPEMYRRYVELCERGDISIGDLWIFKTPDRWVLNFPTKKHWRYPSRVEYLEAGLEKFRNTYRERGIESIAFPLLGADKGGIPPETSLRLMESALRDVDIEIEIYKHDASAADDLYETTKTRLLSAEASVLASRSGMRKQDVAKVMQAMRDPAIVQLNQLAHVEGIGIRTLEKLFKLSGRILRAGPSDLDEQKPLF